jgi:hypothetical protein
MTNAQQQLSNMQQEVFSMIPDKATAISKVFGKRHADQMEQWPIVVELRKLGLIEIVSMGSGRGVRKVKVK